MRYHVYQLPALAVPAGGQLLLWQPQEPSSLGVAILSCGRASSSHHYQLYSYSVPLCGDSRSDAGLDEVLRIGFFFFHISGAEVKVAPIMHIIIYLQRDLKATQFFSSGTCMQGFTEIWLHYNYYRSFKSHEVYMQVLFIIIIIVHLLCCHVQLQLAGGPAWKPIKIMPVSIIIIHQLQVD